jgi:hypothetical protein
VQTTEATVVDQLADVLLYVMEELDPDKVEEARPAVLKVVDEER